MMSTGELADVNPSFVDSLRTSCKAPVEEPPAVIFMDLDPDMIAEYEEDRAFEAAMEREL